MISSGFLLKGSTCRIVTLSGSKRKHSQIANKFHKLELGSKPTQEDVAVFIQALLAYCSDYSVETIIINQRTSRGTHAGGSATFRIEGIILASSPVLIKQVHPATIRATDRNKPKLKTSKPDTIDLGKAYDLAFEGLD